MTPEKRLSAVLTQLNAVGVDLITIGSTGPDNAQTVILRLRNEYDLAKVAPIIEHFRDRDDSIAEWDVKVSVWPLDGPEGTDGGEG